MKRLFVFLMLALKPRLCEMVFLLLLTFYISSIYVALFTGMFALVIWLLIITNNLLLIDFGSICQRDIKQVYLGTTFHASDRILKRLRKDRVCIAVSPVDDLHSLVRSARDLVAVNKRQFKEALHSNTGSNTGSKAGSTVECKTITPNCSLLIRKQDSILQLPLNPGNTSIFSETTTTTHSVLSPSNLTDTTTTTVLLLYQRFPAFFRIEPLCTRIHHPYLYMSLGPRS